MSWLGSNAEKEDAKKVVARLKCQVCAEFQPYKRQEEFWVVRADSVRISNVRDHAKNDQHAHAMSLLKKQEAAGLGPSTYAPIAQAFNKLSDDEREKLGVKFNIAYFLAIENLPHTQHTPKFVNWKLAMEFALVRHTSMRMLERSSCITSQSREDELREAFLVVWCDRNGSDEKVHTRMEYFTVMRPHSVTAQGLLECKEVSAEQCKKLANIGTDGASANIACLEGYGL